MASSERKAIAIAKADGLLNELHICEPAEIDIERIAIFKGADVRYAPLRGMDGCLVRKGESAELGHFFLHPHTRQIETVDKQQANNWSEKQETEEYEANLFAAELLMPRRLFAPRGEGQEPSFKLIESLAEEFSTTLTATAVQFVRTTQEECALVSAADRHRKWFILSPGFDFQMLEDDYIHGHSCAAEVNSSKLSSRSSDIEAGFWFEGFHGDHKSLITEDARFFPSLGRSLSLLWIHEAI